MHMKKMEPWVLPVTLVCLALGALIAFMLRTKLDEYEDHTNANPMRAIISLQSENGRLRGEKERIEGEYKKLNDKYMAIITEISQNKSVGDKLVAEMNNIRMRAGLIAVQGSGVVITIDDSNSMRPNITPDNAAPLLTHDIDLLMLVNELRAAGAEAIELNGQRVAGTTAIRCVGPSIKVNDQPISAPFVIKAIGKTDVLYGAVNLPFGVLDGLKPLGIKVIVDKRDMIRVSAITAPPTMEVAKPAPDTGTTEDK